MTNTDYLRGLRDGIRTMSRATSAAYERDRPALREYLDYVLAKYRAVGGDTSQLLADERCFLQETYDYIGFEPDPNWPTL